MTQRTSGAPIGLAEDGWFRLVGEAAAAIGTDGFHQKLVELFGSTIAHEASWIIRYSRVAPPDVIHTANVPDDVVDFYAAHCAAVDPFSAHWKLREEPGVRTLAGFRRSRDAEIDPQPYNRLYLAAADVEDELGVFFSTVGHSSLGLFLVRARGRFTAAEVRRAEFAFPVLDGFHKAHIGRIFDRLRVAGDANESELVSRPTLVQDRFGLEIFASPSWREALAGEPDLAEALAEAGDQRSVQFAGYTIKVERFDRYFPLAPSGTMFVLIPRGDGAPGDPPPRVADPVAPDPDMQLTAREKQVFDLLMAGETTGCIAQKLKISKGTVKNNRLRIYRKADVTSDRALVQKFGRPIASEQA